MISSFSSLRRWHTTFLLFDFYPPHLPSRCSTPVLLLVGYKPFNSQLFQNWIYSQQQLAKYTQLLSACHCSCNRGFTSDEYLHTRRLKKVRSILVLEMTANLVSGFVLNRLGYCKTVFAGLPASTIAPLQRVQNAAARLVKGLSPRNHTTSAIHIYRVRQNKVAP